MQSNSDDVRKPQVSTNVLLAVCAALLAIIIGLLVFPRPSSPETTLDEYVSQVQKCIDEERYQNGIDKADEGLRCYPDSNELRWLKEQCNKALKKKEPTSEEARTEGSGSEDKIAEILNRAYEFEKSDDYDEALRIIKDGLMTYADSNELKSRRDEYQRKAKEIDDCIARASNKSSNEESRAVIQQGLETYPNSQKLKDELQKYPTGPESRELPWRWYGTYTGTFRNDDGTESEKTRRTLLVLDDTYVDGPISGIMYVDSSVPGDGGDQFYVEGTFDSATRSIYVEWTGWIQNSGTISTRCFWGTVSEDYKTIDGETTTTEGEHWSNWDSYNE